MSTLTLAAGRPVLADRLVSRGLMTDVVLIATGAGLTAIAAQVVIPMWPVSITGQTFAVLLVGVVLGATRGALAMALYLLLGAVGLPVFSEGTSGSLLALPSGGYIVGFVFAAALAGYCAQHECDRHVWRAALAFVVGTAVIYAVGLPWLYFYLADAGVENALAATIEGGLLPFLLGDAIKAALAGALLPIVWRGVRRADAAADREN